jgi:hypothetical protein
MLRLVELTRAFTNEHYRRGLESWGWLDLAGKVPVFTSLFGDVFFRAADGFWLLDTIEGTLSRPWDSVEALRAELNTEDGQDQYLLGGLAMGADRRGVVLGAEQVYVFTPPPILGGGFELDNVGVLDFVVALDLAGQLHDQVRHLAPGTEISGIAIADE